MKYIDAERLKAEVERIKNDDNPNSFVSGLVYLGKKETIDEFCSLIDSLQQEQPSLPGIEENGIPGKDFIPVGWVDACEKYGKWKFVKVEQQEQPELQPIGYAETYYQKGLYDGIIKGRMEILKWLEDIEKRKAEPVIVIKQQEHPEVFDTVAFQKGVQEGRRLEREDVKSIIQSRIDEILGDAQPNPILRMELQELIKKIEV